MGNCKRIEENLIAYLDAKAGPAVRRQVEMHLAACPACRQRTTEFRQLWGLLDELPAPPPSLAFDAAVQARIAAEPRQRSWWTFLVPSPRLAFATTALAVLSVWLLSVGPSQSPDSSVAQQQSSEAEFGMIRDLPILEDYDLLANFDALSELPVQPAVAQPESQRP